MLTLHFKISIEDSDRSDDHGPTNTKISPSENLKSERDCLVIFHMSVPSVIRVIRS